MDNILILSSSYLSKDPRVRRQIIALKDNHNVIACGLNKSNIGGVVDLPILYRPSKKDGFFNRVKNLLNLIFNYEQLTWNIEVFKKLDELSIDIIIVNDPREMPLAVKLKKSSNKNIKIYFDLHEYYIHVDRFFIRNRMYRILTDRFQKYADALSTVSNEIANLYSERYFREVSVITNACKYYDFKPVDRKDNCIKMVHHGVLNRDRKLEEMIKLMYLLDGRFYLDFYLVGSDANYLNKLKRMAKSIENISFREPVDFDQIVPTLNSYDIGLFILSDKIKSYKYALPNKIFEFVQARLAIAVSPNISMAKLVNKYSNGIVASGYKAESLAEKLNELRKNEIFEMKQNSNLAARELNEATNLSKISKLIIELTV